MKPQLIPARKPTRGSSPVSFAIVCATSLFLGCSSTPKNEGAQASAAGAFGLTSESILLHEDVKGKEPVIFAHPLERTREAALRSLTFVGCEIKKQQPYYLAGRRPNKFGLFVGSGGETVEVFLYPKNEIETQVWVDTDMSFVGIAGQQGWNDQVIKEMTSLLNRQPVSP